MSGIKFIHAADLHLDCPFYGLKELPQAIFEVIQGSTFRAFDNLVEAAIDQKVDFVLFVGDLYETENRSLKAQFKLREGLKKLADHNIHSYIVHGNHDPVTREYNILEWPEKVHFFSEGEVSYIPYEKDGQTLANIYGFSYGGQAEYNRMVRQYERQGNAKYHIGMLHGSYEGESAHAPYAPFTLQEMKERGMDYFALGHIHKREILSVNPYIVYSGNSQGRSRKESGEKGCYLVELEGGKTELTFLSLSELRWENCEIQISGMKSLDEFLHRVDECKNEYRHAEASTLLIPTLMGVKPSWWAEEVNGWDEILEICNEGEIRSRSFIYIPEIKDKTTGSLVDFQKLERDPFFKELLEASRDESLTQGVMEEMVKNRRLRKFLDEGSIDIEEIQKEAFDIVLNELMK